LIVAGCHRGIRDLKLHYIAQFVPGTRAVFAPARIAVAPSRISMVPAAASPVSELEVGSVLNEESDVAARLFISDPAPLLTNALLEALFDSGLRPSVIDRSHVHDLGARKPPSGFDFLLSCDLLRLTVNQRFSPQHTVHGQVFTMRSSVEMACTVHDRAGKKIFAATVTGDETEPPQRVGNEAFLPLETDPAESLSVALSRAVGGLILMLRDRAALPLSS
jgi:hypothetical protein